jgi:alkanesulfonate monooxygenase SsuD/methylene tetrahydromethanopterin reductase-like flavin-dependent oxidoreductase (luciferase family)
VDVLSSGRLVLGLGAGWNQPEHAAFGLPFDNTSARLAELERGIGEIRRINNDYNPTPTRNPLPILIGGSGKAKSIAVAVRCADEYNGAELTPAQFAACSQRLDDMCEAIGRPVESLRRSVNLSVLIAKTDRDLHSQAGKLGQIMPEFAQQDAGDVLSALRAQAPGPWVVGTPEQIINQVAEYRQFRLSRLILTVWLLEELEDTLDLISRYITPFLSGVSPSADS